MDRYQQVEMFPHVGGCSDGKAKKHGLRKVSEILQRIRREPERTSEESDEKSPHAGRDSVVNPGRRGSDQQVGTTSAGTRYQISHWLGWIAAIAQALGF